MRCLAGVNVAIVLSTGCAITFDGERKVTRRPAPTEIRVREGTLPGAAALQPDGTVRFALELDKLCQRDRVSIEEIGVDRRKRYTAAGVVMTAGALAVVGLGIYMLTQIETDENGFTTDGSTGLIMGGALSITMGGIGAGFSLAFRYGEPANYPATKGYEKTEERQVTDGTETLACADGAASTGDLVLAAPWGATTTARAGSDGIAVFAVDWGVAAGIPKAQLATAWRITSVKSNATWTPAAADVERVVQLIAAARDRVVVGPTPAQLEPAIDAKGIEIGGGGELIATVKNAGGSTATGVTAKTRSSIAALHGLTFTFGTIQPGSSATRTLAVTVGADVVDDSATVLLVVIDAKGAAIEVTKQLTLTRALCPGGKLTRAKYDEKRAKLKKTVTEGLMTQAEFERLDGDLLRCLE